MRLTAVVACVLAGVSVANVANAACSDFFKFEPDAKLSVNAISKLGAPDDSAPTTPNGGSIVYWAFDREDYPARGEWAAYAVVYAASSQSYEWHPGGVIWAKWRGQDLYAAYDLKRAKIRGGVTLAVRLARHTAQSWENPAVPDDLIEIGALMNLSPAHTLKLVHEVDGVL